MVYYGRSRVPRRAPAAGLYVKQKRKVPEKIKKYVKKEMKREVEKRWKTESFQLNLDYNLTTNIYTFLNGISQGDNTFERAGNQITITEIEIMLTVTPAANLNSRVRLLMFFDKMPNGQLPNNNASTNSIFAEAPAGAANATTLLSPLNPNYFPSRYTLLVDRLFTVHQEGGSSNIAVEKVVKIHKKGLKTKVQYHLNNNTIAALVKNSLIIFAISDETGVSQPIMIGRSVIKYIDA